MKIAFLLVLASPSAFAAHVNCVSDANSDRELRIFLSAAGAPTQVSLANLDWGTGGNGGIQALAPVRENKFRVADQAGPGKGLSKGDILRVQSGESGIKKVIVSGEPGKPEAFTCN